MPKRNPGGAGQGPGQPAGPLPPLRRVTTWLAWWVLLLALWVAVDDSLAPDELLVGAGAAALAALLAEVVFHQAAVRFQVRVAWLVRALRLPGEVAGQTGIVFAALARTVLGKAPPPSGGFRERPLRYGDDSPLGVTRRLLLTGARSLAPNEFVVGIDAERDVMVTHQLVTRR